MAKQVHATVLGCMLFGISALLVARFPPDFLAWGEPLATSPLFMDLVMLIAPAVATWTGLEFLWKDSRGWAGIFFHLVILYAAIVYVVFCISDTIAVFQQGAPIAYSIIDCSTVVVAWVAFAFYYD